jgi:hypothetical protein
MKLLSILGIAEEIFLCCKGGENSKILSCKFTQYSANNFFRFENIWNSQKIAAKKIADKQKSTLKSKKCVSRIE